MYSNVAYYRKKLGYSQTKLGSLVGLSQNTISAIEHGHYFCSVKHALQLSIVLDVPVEKLFILQKEGSEYFGNEVF